MLNRPSLQRLLHAMGISIGGSRGTWVLCVVLVASVSASISLIALEHFREFEKAVLIPLLHIDLRFEFRVVVQVDLLLVEGFEDAHAEFGVLLELPIFDACGLLGAHMGVLIVRDCAFDSRSHVLMLRPVDANGRIA